MLTATALTLTEGGGQNRPRSRPLTPGQLGIPILLRQEALGLDELGPVGVRFRGQRDDLTVRLRSRRGVASKFLGTSRAEHASEAVRVGPQHPWYSSRAPAASFRASSRSARSSCAGMSIPGVAGGLSIETSSSLAVRESSAARVLPPSTCARTAAAPRRCTSTWFAQYWFFAAVSASLKPCRFAISARAVARSPPCAAPSARAKLVIAAAQGKRSHGKFAAVPVRAAAAAQSRRSSA